MILKGFEPKYPQQLEAWKRFGVAIGAKEIEYRDLGKGEKYRVVLDNGEEFVLSAAGNQYDGGFLTMGYPGMPIGS